MVARKSLAVTTAREVAATAASSSDSAKIKAVVALETRRFLL
jgi:hypothetical protein